MNYQAILKKLRIEKNLKQEDIATILEISRATYSHFETQYDIIPLKYLDKLSNYFNVSINYLLGIDKKRRHIVNNKTMNLELFSKRLKEWRKENKITQTDLARDLNTSHSTITGYEKERCFIKTSFLYTICKKYKISADYLLGKVDNPKYIA